MTRPQALIIDDEPDILELLRITLEKLNLAVTEAASLGQARALLAGQAFALCLTDMRLPDGDGLDLVEFIQDRYPDMPVAVITAHGNTDIAVEALKKGAFDFVSKPVELKRLRAMVQTALELNAREDDSVTDSNGLTGDSEVMDSLRRQIARVARSQAPIFISGESGSGKELVARAIHYNGPRANGPFMPVNCGAIPSELMESEFFGHKKGSFTGAYQDKRGLFQAADGGTLFLDEVADLPLAMQVKLLRAIQEKSIRPVGAQEETVVDVRILSATHKNLAQEVAAGRFRQDLFYRVNVIEIPVPSLREHPEDIPALADIFLTRFARETGTTPPRLAPEALQTLRNHPFPGNVRELENTLERAFTLCRDGVITAGDLSLHNNPPPPPPGRDNGRVSDPAGDYNPGNGLSLDQYLAEVEKEILVKSLEETRWNKTAAAERLGISFRQLRYKLHKLGVE